MKAIRSVLAFMLGWGVLTAASRAPAVTFLSDDFNSYADSAAVTAAGWSFENPYVTDPAGTWQLVSGDHSTKSRYNPPTIDGSPSTGNFLMSECSWWENVESGFPFNLADSGASHDLYTPTFSTLGSGSIWLHADIAALLNQQGNAIFDIEVSTNGGNTWWSAFHRVSPDRGFWGCFCEPPGGWPMTFLSDTTNADGFHGHLDLDLSPWAADAANVQVRFRHYEPADDWWIRLDNVVIDSTPVMHASTTVFEEKFSDGFGPMTLEGVNEQSGSPLTWTTDGALPFSQFGQYVAGEAGGQDRQVNRLEHTHPGDPSDPIPNPDPDFAFIDTIYGTYNSANEYMMTPVLDLSGAVEVFLGYEDEIWWYTKNGEMAATVLLMRDADGDGPDSNDEIVKVIFNYDQDAIGTEDGEDPWYAERLFSVPEAAHEDNLFFAWHYEGYNSTWWAIDSIKVSANLSVLGDANDDGVVDDADASILAANWHQSGGWAEGDFNNDGMVDEKDASILASHWHAGWVEGANVPEPSMLTLLLAVAVMAWLGRRGR